MSPKKWLKLLMITTLLFIGIPSFIIMGINYYIDPLWNFTHANEYNDYQVGFNERQQKTNYIHNHNFNYDSLLMGTSRITYLNQNSFKKDTVFNYSLSDMHIDEFIPYIQYAEKENGKPFHKIYIEMSMSTYIKDILMKSRAPKFQIEKAEDTFYPIVSLFSKSTLALSKRNYIASKNNHFDGPRSYNRGNVAQTSYPNDRLPAIREKFRKAIEEAKGTPWNYDENFAAKLQKIKDAFPNSEIIVFTELVPASHLEIVLGRAEFSQAYNRAMKEMVAVFGTVYSFHNENEVTTNDENFFDMFHYYPSVGDRIIYSLENPTSEDSIATIVTSENIDEYLSSLK